MTNSKFDFENFQGFESPNYTPTPDLIFDHIMQELNEGELKVLLYIIRRTFGFKKPSDDISLAQMVDGIITRDGKVLDRGTGLSKLTVMKALRFLKEKNLIDAARNRNEEKGNLPTTYRLKMGATLGKESIPRVGKENIPSPRYRNLTTQQTVLQKTVKQQPLQPNQDKNNNSGGDRKQGVVVALAKIGITKTVAQRLASRHKETTIYQQIDYHEYDLATKPDDPKITPGRLRRRIEENWAAPDGYTPDWRDRQTGAKQQSEARQEALEASQREREEEDQRRQEAALKKRQAALQTYQSAPELTELWKSITTQIEARSHDLKSKLLADCLLVKVEDGAATIWTPSQFIRDQLERQYSPLIKRLLAKERQINLDDLALEWILP